MNGEKKPRQTRGRKDETPEQRSARLKAKAEEKAAAKAEQDQLRLARFKALRARLTAECDAERGVPKRLYPLFSASWVSDMRCSEEKNPSEDQSEIHQERLIWYYDQQKRLSLYDEVADLIGQDPTDRDYILSRYQGEYTYFRYAAVGRDRATYVKGRIRIGAVDGQPIFSHWSHDYDQAATEPEHTGFVFRHESNLFLVGRADGVLRLSIARTIRGPLSEGRMPGLVLSMRNSTRDPFAARFLLVPASNRNLLAKLDPDLGGEGRFDELAKANEELHYMLLDLGDRLRRS